MSLTKEDFSVLIKGKMKEEESIKKDKSILLRYVDTLTIEDLSDLTDLELEDYIYILKNNSKIYSYIEKSYKENKEDLIIENFIYAYELINSINVEIDSEDFYTENTYKQFLHYIRNYRLLSSLETNNLFIRMSKGDNEARNLLILHNIGLVIFIAKKYTSFNIDLIDLIQEGIIGLMKAIEKFDYTKGYKFSMYAHYWIKLYIDRFLSYIKNAFSIPVHIDIKLSEYNRRRNELEQKFGRHLTNKELSEMLNIDIEVIERLNRLNSQVISLNEKINEDDDEELQDKLESDINIEEDVIFRSLSTEILEAFKMANLNEGELYVLTRRYIGVKETNETIAKHLGITYQRVQQLEKTALEKLRKPLIAKKLYAYYKDDDLDVTIKLKVNFLEYFEGNFFKVLYLIENLSKEDKSLLYSLYKIETLKKYVKLTNTSAFIDLIYKIKNKLPKTKEKSIDNLLIYFNEYPKEEVIKLLENLINEEKSILFSFYNKEYTLVKQLTDSDLRNVKPIINKINKQLIKNKMNFILNTRNLLKYLNLTKEEIMEILIDYPTYKDAIRHFYNEELTSYNFVNDNNYVLFYNTLNSLKEISKNITLKLN